MDPSLVGPSVSEEFYDLLVKKKIELDAMRKYQKVTKKHKSIFGKNYPDLFGRL